MKSIYIVLPILTVLMFDLGLSLRPSDFAMIVKRPKAMLAGLFGQIIILPLIALGIGLIFNLPPLFLIGLMLVACCPGGSSSNAFSKIANGDVALSVSLTAASSVITLFTIPLIMQWVTTYAGHAVGITLPVKNLLIQNLFTALTPIIIGIAIRHFWGKAADAIDKVLSKAAFPLLMFLALVFFIQNRQVIAENIILLGGCSVLLITLCVLAASAGSRILKLKNNERRTIIIEVGMQNAAQAIAIASSPFIFADDAIATPAIVYALFMNVVLLTYVKLVNKQ